MSGEFDALAHLLRDLPSAPAGETWAGDDAAVVRVPDGSALLLAADAVVAGVHADLTLTGLDDLGWKAMVANLSDLAAMGGRPAHALVTVAGPPGTDLAALYRGLIDAATRYRCPVVGGDLTNAPTLVVAVAVTGAPIAVPVLRSGASAGDGIWVSGPLGAAAAGLRTLRHRAAFRRSDPPTPTEARLIEAHARPRPPLAAGEAAVAAGATALIDVSDGLAADLGHIADASQVGFALDAASVAPGATEAEALGGGEDYELVFCAAEDEAVARAFASLPAPIRIGTCVADRSVRTLHGEPVAPQGWQHDWH